MGNVNQPWSIPHDQPRIKLGETPNQFKSISTQVSNYARPNLILPPPPPPRDATVYSGSLGGQHS